MTRSARHPVSTRLAPRTALALAALLLAGCATAVTGTPIGPVADGATAGENGSNAAPVSTAGAEPGGAAATGPPPTDTASGPPTASTPSPAAVIGSPPPTVDGIPLGNADTVWDVDVAADAVILGFDTVATGLRDADPQAGRYTFATGSLASVDLAPGRPLIVAGHGIGRIESIDRAGESTVISTGAATLADVIDRGTIGWDAAVDWDADWIIGEQPPAFRAASDGRVKLSGLVMVDEAGRHIDVYANRTAAGDINWTYAVAGSEILFSIVPGGDQMSVAIQVTRPQLTYTARGTVGSAHSVGSATYSDGTLKAATIDTGGIDSKLELTIAAAGAGSVPEFSFTLPGLMFKYPIMVGPVLVVIGLSAQLVGVAEVPASGSVTFQSDFGFSSTGGFRYDGSSIVSTAQLGGFTMDAGGADPAGYIGEYVNAQYGVAFPKVEVSLFGTGPSAYIRPGIFLGAELTWGPVCKTAYIRAELVGGYDFTLLGVSLASDKQTFWEDRKDARGESCG